MLLVAPFATAIASAQAQSGPVLDDVTLAQRGNTVIAAKIDRTEPPTGVLEIDLPDLETDADSEVMTENVRAAAVLYYAAQLEELKLFAAVDKIVESFVQGKLPILWGNAGSEIDDYWKTRP